MGQWNPILRVFTSKGLITIVILYTVHRHCSEYISMLTIQIEEIWNYGTHDIINNPGIIYGLREVSIENKYQGCAVLL